MMSSRRHDAFCIRVEAARAARLRHREKSKPNGDETHYCTPDTGNPSYVASFTKGLPHDRKTGLLKHPSAFTKFVRAIESSDPAVIAQVPLGPTENEDEFPCRYRSGIARGRKDKDIADSRAWESMAAGNAFDLQGPDPQSVAMPPAPRLKSNEMVFEMTDMYLMAICRDIPFDRFRESSRIKSAIDTLNSTAWISGSADFECHLTEAERARRRKPFTTRTVFRGATVGDDIGPYVSQFLLVGNKGLAKIHDRTDGYVRYGAQLIDQRVRYVIPKRDYMTTWEQFIDVQNAADLRGRETYMKCPRYRFIATPRDLCTYVHYDALYQAYLNACIFLLSIGAPFDKGIPFTCDDDIDKQQGFALFGGPHILTLVTEVATRALKAVRYQKYNVHRRARPEAIAGLIERYANHKDRELFLAVRPLYKALDKKMLKYIAEHNARQNETLEDYGNPRSEDYDGDSGGCRNYLLPMAYPEGSPMHPSYGAGHATVAGACVTILKSFFDYRWELPFAYKATEDGSKLVEVGEKLTVEGELNKLCSNISIGRGWAGVHWYSDYIESIRLGEKVAIGMLEDQMFTYQEDFTMTLRKFDGSIHVFRKPTITKCNCECY